MATDRQSDRDLTELFQELRKEDHVRVPDFHEIMARAWEEEARTGRGTEVLPEHSRPESLSPKDAKRRIPRRLAWAGSVLAAASAATLLLVQLPTNPDAEFERVVRSFSADPASGAWRSPTDALLHLPGAEILSTIPSIGISRWPASAGDDLRRNEL